MMSDPASEAHAEVVRLHYFLESWFRGTIGRDRLDPDFADTLHDDFENVQPAGVIRTRGDLIEGIGAAYGMNTDFRIVIETPRLLGLWPGMILYQYVEYQVGARNSATENRRLSTVLFERSDRLIWRYLTEVGLPA